MSVTVEVPTTVQTAIGMPAVVQMPSGSIAEILQSLSDLWPAIRPRLISPTGTLHGFVNVYVNDVDVRQMNGVETVVSDGQTMVILSAVSGG